MDRAVCAIDQIRERVHELSRRNNPRKMLLKIGSSAELAIRCHLDNRNQLPASLFDVPVQRTTEFKGWEVYVDGREVD